MNAIDFDEIDYFGGCPECGRLDAMLNIERNHFAVCHAHRVMWQVGSNLFGAWRYESESVWKENADLLSTYREVDALFNPRFYARFNCSSDAPFGC